MREYRPFLFVATTLSALLVAVATQNVAYAPLAYIPTKQSVDTPSAVALLFVGDIQLDRYIRKMGERVGYATLVETLPEDEPFKSADFIFGNLEGPVTTHRSVSIDSEIGTTTNYIFTFSPESLSVLHTLGIGAVSVANNHIYNFGSDGILQTKALLSHEGISALGLPGKDGVFGRVFMVAGTPVAIVVYNEFGAPSVEDSILLLEQYEESAIPSIVYAHWGEEYIRAPSERERALARRFIESGADAVLGSHTHVIGESEIYRGAPIYYSLGNFIFDQYWDNEVSCGLLLTLHISEGTITQVEEHFARMRPNGTTVLENCADTKEDRASNRS